MSTIYRQIPPQAVAQNKFHPYYGDSKNSFIYLRSGHMTEEFPLMPPEVRTVLGNKKEATYGKRRWKIARVPYRGSRHPHYAQRHGRKLPYTITLRFLCIRWGTSHIKLNSNESAASTESVKLSFRAVWATLPMIAHECIMKRLSRTERYKWKIWKQGDISRAETKK